MQPPPTQYVERDGISIAYQVVGDGPVDLVISHGFVTHLDLQWANPGISRFLSRCASFARLIIYEAADVMTARELPTSCTRLCLRSKIGRVEASCPSRKIGRHRLYIRAQVEAVLLGQDTQTPH